MNPLAYFHAAHAQGHRPTLLEFTHPLKRTPLVICGIEPTETLLVRDGQLVHNDRIVGKATDIFDVLAQSETTTTAFFPAWLGFFSYEFARYLGKLTHASNLSFPDAYFYRYTQGLVIDNDTIIHHDELSQAKALPEHQPRTRALNAHRTPEQFFEIVADVQQRIRRGDVYQVNASLPFYFDVDASDMLPLYASMRTNNKSPFMGIMSAENWWFLSGSPERLFSLHNNKLTTRPIAGTKSRMANSDADNLNVHALTSCPKENAEHAMLVDLMRNDLNQVAIPGTVSVDEDRSVEFYSHVMHLVSEVSCITTKHLKEIFTALFPGGTITGAPKGTVMDAIAAIESVPRGPYTGAFGYVSSGCGVDFNILIRTICVQNDRARINAGAGIVIDSDAASEWHEIIRKAQAIIDILQCNATPKQPRQTLIGPACHTAANVVKKKSPRVLFIENHDSFSFNIVAAMRTLSADVTVASLEEHVDLQHFSHVLVGPGPGNPRHLPKLMAFIATSIRHGLPLLGICLGHQALGLYHGAAIIKLAMPIHGKPCAITHFGQGLFEGISSPARFTRYHSLAIDSAPPDFMVDAYSDDDTIMAIRHKTQPLFGVQFHPESYLSEGGFVVLDNFLRTPSP